MSDATKRDLAVRALADALGHAAPSAPPPAISKEAQAVGDWLAGRHTPEPGSAAAQLREVIAAERTNAQAPSAPPPVRSVPDEGLQRAIDEGVRRALEKLGVKL